MSEQGGIPSPDDVGFWYLAGPYSDIIDARYAQHLRFAGRLKKTRLKVFSTIVENHIVAALYKLPTDAAYWRDYNLAVLKGARGLIVMDVAGVHKSVGTREEVEFARKEGKPIWWVSFDDADNLFSWIPDRALD